MYKNHSTSSEKTDNEKWFSVKNSLVILTLISIAGFLIRVNYFPLEVPFDQDVLDYFGYAVKTSNFGHLLDDWFIANNGWSIFLSLFFSLMTDNSFFDHVYAQRILAMIISTVTIIPVYFLCKEFFSKKIALIGAALFIFNPYIIKYSIAAGTDVIFTFIAACMVYSVLKKEQKFIYVQFLLCGIISLIRYEGLILLIPLTFLFFLKNKKNYGNVKHYFLAVLLFIIIILPITVFEYQNFEHDGLVSAYYSQFDFQWWLIHGFLENDNAVIIENFSKLIPEDEKISTYLDENGKMIDRTEKDLISNNLFEIVAGKGIENNFKLFAISLFPIFLILIPYGIYAIFKEKDFKKIAIILMTATFAVPAIYAFFRDFQDVKYVLVLFPIFSLLSLFIIEKIEKKNFNIKILYVIIITILLSSTLFIMELEKIETLHNKESFIIAEKVIELTDGYNIYPDESRFIKAAEMKRDWPTIPQNDENGHLILQANRVYYSGFNSLEEFLEYSEDKGLTHLIIDGDDERPIFLNEIFLNEKRYDFLKKIYDSIDYELDYHVKIFEIDYVVFNKID